MVMLEFFHLFVKLKCPDLPATFKCQLTGEISDTWAFFQTNVAINKWSKKNIYYW